MQFFFVPEGQQNWPIAKDQPWQFFYHGAPLLTLLPTLPALLVLMGSTRYPKLWVHRPVALFIVLCFALGPGLTVNMIFKDHWGRPRPRQVVELGGNQTYLPPLAPGEPGKGKSFPCGHSSVGFTYAAAFFIFRERRPRLAFLMLTGGLILGGMMGIGRMAAGGHFFSDVLWSAYLPLGIAYLLSPMLRKAPQSLAFQNKIRISPKRRRCEIAAWMAVIALFAGSALLAYPFKKDFRFQVPPQDLTDHLKAFEIIARNATISISVTPQAGYRLNISGEGRGFGTPANNLATAYSVTKDGLLCYAVEYKGLFTDVETRLNVEVSHDLLASGFVIYQRKDGDGQSEDRIKISQLAARAAI